MTGKFVLTRSSNGKYHFNLVAPNGQVIASSQMYESKESAENGIDSVRKNAPGAALEDKSDIPHQAKPAAPSTAVKS
jgi:uncharacterized protein YegP (UPF0339 family)